jgi:hypothetical protein
VADNEDTAVLSAALGEGPYLVKFGGIHASARASLGGRSGDSPSPGGIGRRKIIGGAARCGEKAQYRKDRGRQAGFHARHISGSWLAAQQEMGGCKGWGAWY